jgi:DNA-binding NtrC family response regulator
MKAKILVVDDMPEVLLMITELLSGAGYSVLAASTFEDGRRLAAGANPDLVLIDVRLGAYNGLQLAVREHVDHPLRPVIVMSGYADPVIEAEARRQGAEFLEKPVQPDGLLPLIERLLTQRNAPSGIRPSAE